MMGHVLIVMTERKASPRQQEVASSGRAYTPQTMDAAPTPPDRDGSMRQSIVR